MFDHMLIVDSKTGLAAVPKDGRRIWYFPLESVKSRYTEQLCRWWMPEAFLVAKQPTDSVIGIFPQDGDVDITTGVVLDAVGRSLYCFDQIAVFLAAAQKDLVKDGDIIYLQDFWTPGFEAVPYLLDQKNIKVSVYAMLHAQSVDEFDFTHPMMRWMRGFELGLDRLMSGIFVASSIHRKQLRAGGFKAPIHVVGLPIHRKQIREDWFTEHGQYPAQGVTKEKIVVFSSRFDKEKNPCFMLKVAEKFLTENPDWEWYCTSSAKTLRSNDPDFKDVLSTLHASLGGLSGGWFSRFFIMTDLRKSEYYRILERASIQFNCASQDYVSWTLLESAIFDCIPVYPNYRSFPECLGDGVCMDEVPCLYEHLDVQDAVDNLAVAASQNFRWHAPRGASHDPSIISDLGRRATATYVLRNNPKDEELTIWDENCQAFVLANCNIPKGDPV